MGSERTPDLDLPALRAVIAGVRERLAKATPGPWIGPCPSDQAHEVTRVVWTADGEAMVAQALSLHDVPDEEGFTQEQALYNAALIASAPADLTTLSDACERLAEENERMREQLTAAEAAREEDFASFVASELFAQEVRQNAMEYAAKCCEGRAMGNKNTTARHEAEKCAMAIRYHARNAHLVRALDLPTPSAALQRVREQEAERALRWAADNPPGSGGARDLPEARADDPVDQWQGYIERGLAALLPTPDAEGK